MNLIEVIEEKDNIFRFHRKIKKIEYKLNKKNDKKYMNIIVIPTMISWLSLVIYMFSMLVDITLQDVFPILFGGLLISLFSISFINLIFSFFYKKINKIKKNKELKNPKYFSSYTELKDINNFTYKFEKSLNKKEEKYYLSKNPFYFNKDYNYYFQIYKESLNKMNAEEIKKNNEMLIKNIKTNFETKEQKELFSKITYILTHNTADKELEELYSVLNNEEKRVELVNQKNQIIKKI